MRTLLTLALCAAGLAAQTASRKPDPPAPISGTPGPPRVVVMDDSISTGYMLDARAAPDGVANVHRPKENRGPGTHGVQMVEAWLGKGNWDVIHFNFGPHDPKKMFDGLHQVSPDDYERNLGRIVFRLKQSGARLIFATTTPAPEGNVPPPRAQAGAALYNGRAAKAMKANGVAVNDLYSFALPHPGEWRLPVDVHFKDAGSAALGKEVARVITEQLKSVEAE